jgi:hypothetical protein
MGTWTVRTRSPRDASKLYPSGKVAGAVTWMRAVEVARGKSVLVDGVKLVVSCSGEASTAAATGS